MAEICFGLDFIAAGGTSARVRNSTDVKSTARAIFDATVRYHHPAHADEKDADLSARVNATPALRGLKA